MQAKKIDYRFRVPRPHIEIMCAFSFFIGNIAYFAFLFIRRLKTNVQFTPYVVTLYLVRPKSSFLPDLSMDAYPIVFIHCGISGTHRTLNKSVEHYPQCNNCSGQPNVHRRKRKTVVQNDLNRNNKGTKYTSYFYYETF